MWILLIDAIFDISPPFLVLFWPFLKNAIKMESKVSLITKSSFYANKYSNIVHRFLILHNLIISAYIFIFLILTPFFVFFYVFAFCPTTFNPHLKCLPQLIWILYSTQITFWLKKFPGSGFYDKIFGTLVILFNSIFAFWKLIKFHSRLEYPLLEEGSVFISFFLWSPLVHV